MTNTNPTRLKLIVTPHFIHKLLRTFILLAIVLIFAIQGAQISNLERQNQVRDNEHITQTLLQAVNDLGQPLPTEPSTGKVYLSAQHLSLSPTPASLGQLVYSTAYTDADGQFPVHIAAKNDITHASQSLTSTQQDNQRIFQVLPTVQACARGVSMSYTMTNQPPTDQKVLANGKTLYFFTESLCPNPALLSYVKQINSY